MAKRNFTVLQFHAVFHFCLQINKANITERYIHYVIYTHYRHLFNISGLHKFTLIRNLIKYCCCRPRLTSLFPYEGSSTSGSSEGGFAKIAPFFLFFSFFFSFFFSVSLFLRLFFVFCCCLFLLVFLGVPFFVAFSLGGGWKWYPLGGRKPPQGYC